ncbi:MAG: PepSY domain-containing protein [Pseudomonadota bacterium]
MTDTSLTGAEARAGTARGGALYRMVWKWHFLASLYVLPFMAMLSLTGGLYLYKPQIEAWLYAEKMQVDVPANAEPLSVDAQLAAVEALTQPSRVRGIVVGTEPTDATRIEIDDQAGTRAYVWVDPYDGNVTGMVARDGMIMRQIQKFHGELLLGPVGTKFVELAAHWAIVMFVTGAVLWWPRGRAKWLVLPSGTGRAWWRSTHLFTGMLATILVVPILITGLPWTDVWGGGLSKVQEATGQESWSLKWGGEVPGSTVAGDPMPLDALLAVAQREGITGPWEIRPPRDAEAGVWVGSASVKRPEQSEVVLDQYSGDVLASVDFAENPPLARAVSWGISFHRGEAYGWLNVAQNTLAAALGLMLSVSGFVAWWMRRPAGTLGVPQAPEARLGWPIAALTLVLMLLFPLMGASLLLALALDRLLFRRLGWFRGSGSVPAE